MIPLTSPSSFGEHASRMQSSGIEAAVAITRLDDWLKIEVQPLAHSVSLQPSRTLWQIAPRKYLSVNAPNAAPNQEPPVDGILVKDVTASYAHFLLAGARAANLLSKLTALDLTDCGSSCMVGPVAGLRCIVKRDEWSGELSWHLLCSREYELGVSRALLHAGREFSATFVASASLASWLSGSHAAGGPA
jgi:hypothetical protein